MKPAPLPALPLRPSGAGAFWDYAAVFARLQDGVEARLARRAPPRAPGAPARGRPARDDGEARWDGEGGRLRERSEEKGSDPI